MHLLFYYYLKYIEKFLFHYFSPRRTGFFLSSIKLISLFYYNPNVCFSDLAPNIIYSKTDECCPITHSSTWTVIEFCLRTLMHCLNKPDGALEHSSRTVMRHCACETDTGKKRILNYSWKARIWFFLNLFCISGVACRVAYISKRESGTLFGRANSSEIYRWNQIPPPQTHRKWGKAGHG